MKLTAQGNAYLADGQYANAAATYTHALALEAPNSRANAALYYNRSAAHFKLNRPWLAVRDATLAAETDPRRSAPAWWRVAHLSLATGDVPTATDALARRHRVAGGNAPHNSIQAAIAANAAGI
jgi:tetratricopeptide (TPR) repeat protein